MLQGKVQKNLCFECVQLKQKHTRMHSSRMRTVRCSGRRGGGLPQCMLGYCLGVSAPVHAGILTGGVCPNACWDTARGVSGPVHVWIHTPPREQNHRRL